jgi:seryl-tRNA synthetase
MHDINYIRNNPDEFDANLAKRGVAPQAAAILALDEQKRNLITQQGELQAKRNEIAKQVGAIKKAGGNADELMAESRQVNEQLFEIDAQLNTDDELNNILQSLPNLLSADVPDGRDENDNVQEGEPYLESDHLSFFFGRKAHKAHYELGEALNLMDFEGAGKLSGARFTILKGSLARLERALAQFMLDTHIANGYTEISPPVLVRDAAMFGTGQLPKFAEDSFKTTNDYWLIPTAEVPLTNMVAGEILTEAELPLRYCAHTLCFRSEAGSAGRDTRGMLRQHQFSKVELVSITSPEQSAQEHERKLTSAESILQKLELPYRVMLLCAGDTGFGSSKTYDIEAWLPAQNCYREISSISNCVAFQARRMNARYRPISGNKKTEFVHTLNGSGLAVGRSLIAVMENYQQANGAIAIPKVLQPYMGGLTEIIA